MGFGSYSGSPLLACRALTLLYARMFYSLLLKDDKLISAQLRMAIWNMKLYIVVPLVLMILGHWSLILQGTV